MRARRNQIPYPSRKKRLTMSASTQTPQVPIEHLMEATLAEEYALTECESCGCKAHFGPCNDVPNAFIMAAALLSLVPLVWCLIAP